MARSIITLTTDFGVGSPYVAQMKGVLLSAAPEATLVDIMHAISPQNVRQGAIILDDVTPHFPPGSIHVAVVDPGVGTSRRIVCATIGERHYICPDNGLLSRIVRRHRPTQDFAATEPRFWRKSVSNTFHGRDIMAPLAAALSLGVDPVEFGPPIEDLVELPWPDPLVAEGSIRAEVIFVDSFGNLVTEVTADLLEAACHGEPVKIHCGSRMIDGIIRSYAEQPSDSAVVMFGSSGRLEIAVVNGDAARTLGVGVGAEVLLTW